MKLFETSKQYSLKKSIYINLRWIGTIGQFISVYLVYFYFNFNFNFLYSNIIIAIGVISNLYLIFIYKKTQLSDRSALVYLFIDIIQLIDSGIMPVYISETTIDYCYDIHLEEEDYTIGKVLEYLMYTKYYEKQKTLTYCGFKKFHPHDTKSILRIAFKDKKEKSLVNNYLRDICVDSQEIFKTIYALFK